MLGTPRLKSIAVSSAETLPFRPAMAQRAPILCKAIRARSEMKLEDLKGLPKKDGAEGGATDLARVRTSHPAALLDTTAKHLFDQLAAIDRYQKQSDVLSVANQMRDHEARILGMSEIDRLNAAGLTLKQSTLANPASLAFNELAHSMDSIVMSKAAGSSISAADGVGYLNDFNSKAFSGGLGRNDLLLAFGKPAFEDAFINEARRYQESFSKGAMLGLSSRFASAADSILGFGREAGLPKAAIGTFDHVYGAALAFDAQFRRADANDWVRVRELAGVFPSAQIDRLTGITSPLINVANSAKSLSAIGELAVLGASVHAAPPFDPGLVRGLRNALGDWRDGAIDPTSMLDDAPARVTAYVGRGFNTELTDFPARSFDAALTATGLRAEVLLEVLPPPPIGDAPDINVEGYSWLFILETTLRAFIVARLSVIDARWERSRLPNGMRDEWMEKRQKDLDAGKPGKPLIDYADFTDYVRIITRRDNWRECFEGYFKREESVREAFHRLYPIRLVIAHMRILTSEELLLLNVEVGQLLKAIRSAN